MTMARWLLIEVFTLEKNAELHIFFVFFDSIRPVERRWDALFKFPINVYKPAFGSRARNDIGCNEVSVHYSLISNKCF